jgi:hypothetical protein
MRFFLTALFGVLAYWCYPEGVLHTPISQLTLIAAFRFIAAVFFLIVAVRALFESANN